MKSRHLNRRKWIGLYRLLWIGSLLFAGAVYAIADQFDFPLGAPDGSGYGPYATTDYGVKNPDLSGPTCYGVDFSEIWHAGEDWFESSGSASGDIVSAVADGTVKFADPGYSYPGRVVIIEHDVPNVGIRYSMYGHLQDMYVSPNQSVSRGQAIGTVLPQTYGGADNSHLHWEIRDFLDGSFLCEGASGIPGPGYTYPDHPDSYGYTDPTTFVNDHRQIGPDTTPPTINFYDYPERDRWYNGEQYVNWQVSDDRSPRGNIQFQQRWENQSYGGWMTNPDGLGNLQLSWAGEGWHKAYVNAKDEAGNEHEEGLGWWGYDVTTPSNPTSVWSTSHTRWSWSNDNTIEVCWSGASDSGGSGVDGYSYEWSTSSTTIPDTSKDVEESTNCVTSSSLSDGNNWYFHIRTRDNAGNWNSGAAHYGPFYIDTTGPTIDFYSTPQTNHWYNTDQRVWWRISDGGSGWLGFSQNWDSDPGGTSPQFYTYEGFMDFSYIPEAQRDGKHWTYVRAWDQVGNQRMERSGEYWYDATAPTNPSIIINDNATYTNNRNVSLALSASDPTSGLSQMNLRNEGESWAGWRGYQSPYSWTLPSGDGTKTVYAQFKDAADNTSNTASDSIILDTTPPDTTITSGPQGDIPVGDVSFSWTGSDNITPTGDLVYRYRLRGLSDNWSDWSGSTTVNYSGLSDGDYTFEVKARDLAANEDATPAFRSFFVDTTPPDTTITSGPSGCIGTADVTFTWTGSDNRTSTDQLQYSYKLEGFDADWSAWTSATSKSYTGLPDGDYTFKVKAKDGVGHEDPSPAARSFRVDTTPPTGSILINGGDSTTNKIAVHLDITGDDGPVGCGLTEMRLSNDGFNWEAWQPFAAEGARLLPILNRTTWTVHLQLKDLVGNVSGAFTDDIYLDLYPPRPSSESYQLGARVVASGDPTSTSESYGLLSATMGQPIADGRMQGAAYRLESGYQGAWPSVPRGRLLPESYDIKASLVASSGEYQTSESYRLQSATGQSTDVGPRSSENYQLLSGYLPCKLIGDLDGNGRVDVVDIMLVASKWRCQRGDDCYHERYDLDKDGDIDIVDIMKVAARWGDTC